MLKMLALLIIRKKHSLSAIFLSTKLLKISFQQDNKSLFEARSLVEAFEVAVIKKKNKAVAEKKDGAVMKKDGAVMKSEMKMVVISDEM